MAEWIDDADCYRCPDCGFETHNPNKHGCKCPVCGFVADSDKVEEKPKPVPKAFKIGPQGVTFPIDANILMIAQLHTQLDEAQQHLRAYRMAFRLMKRRVACNDPQTVHQASHVQWGQP